MPNGAKTTNSPSHHITGVRLAAKNTLVFGAMRVAQYLLLFGFTVLAARRLGVRDFGILTFGLSLTALIGVTADAGLGRLVNREVARDRTRINAIVNNSLSAKAALSVVSLLLLIAATKLLGYPATTRQVVYVLGISMVFFSFEMFFEGVFKGVERMEYQAYAVTTDKLLTFLVGVGLLLAGKGLIAVAFAFVIARLLSMTVALAVYGRKLARPRFAAVWKEISWLMREAWPFAIFALLGMSYLQLDTILLAQLKGSDSVGVYQAAVRLVLVLMIIPEAVSEAVFPGMSRLFHSSRERLNLVYQNCLRLMLVTGLPLTVALLVLAERIIVPIYGTPFAGAVLLVKITALMVVPRFLAHVPGTLLTAVDQQHRRTAAAGLCVLVSLAANLLLIPAAGAAGAAIASVITNMTLLGTYAALARREGFRGMSLPDVIKPLAATAAMGIFLHFLRAWNLVLIVPAAVAVYLFALYLLGAISTDDREILRQCLARPTQADPEVCA